MHVSQPLPLNTPPHSRLRLLCLLGLLFALLLLAQSGSRGRRALHPADLLPQLDYGSLPIAFTPNAGQSSPLVRYQSHGAGGTLYFTDTGVVLALPGAASQPGADSQFPTSTTSEQRPVSVHLQFEDANPSPRISGSQRLPGVVNFYTGADSALWQTNLHTYAGIVYHDLYPGISLHYEGTAERLKGTYTLAPRADPTRIRWRYTGAQDVRVDAETGDLLIMLPREGTAERHLVEQAPIAWQDIGARRVPVAARYVVESGSVVRFEIGQYDPDYALTIDPFLVYGSYLGGSRFDQAYALSLDPARNILVTGNTLSIDFPGAGTGTGTSDVFVAKLDPTGRSLVYSTYLKGRDTDAGHDIATDDAGNAYITGSTASTDFPTRGPIQDTLAGFADMFITKLGPTGELLYSTYLGDTGYESGEGIAVDRQGSAYVTGGLNLDVVVLKLNPSGSALSYGVFFGGEVGEDQGRAIALTATGEAVITGITQSAGFPVTPNAYQQTCDRKPTPNDFCGKDSFVALLNAAGDTLLYSTYLGGSSIDEAEGIALDSEQNMYVTGHTISNDFPVASAYQATCPSGVDPQLGSCLTSEAFVVKLKADGSNLVYGTYLGGNDLDHGRDIAVDRTGAAYLTGRTNSRNFPTVDAVQPDLSIAVCEGARLCNDAFVTKMDANGSALLFSTYLGGKDHEHGNGIAVDEDLNVYVTGMTKSANFPTTGNGLQATFPDTIGNAFLIKIAPGTGSGTELPYRQFLPFLRQ